MEKTQLRKVIRQHFPLFDQGELVEEIANKGAYIFVPSDTPILEVDSYIKVIPLVIKGSIKVLREEEGEILLYYIKKGESCAMTLSSCLKKEKSRVKAVVQEDTELIVLPVEATYHMIRKYPAWQDFLVETFRLRFDELMHTLDNVVFHKLDERLLHYLTQKSTTLQSTTLYISHQEIADDLASSREVISRLLKQLEQAGRLELARGKIKLNLDYFSKLVDEHL